jgi:hypothetical protein
VTRTSPPTGESGRGGAPGAADQPSRTERHRETLDRVISLLLERETIDGSDLAALVGAPLAVAMEETPGIVRGKI